MKNQLMTQEDIELIRFFLLLSDIINNLYDLSPLLIVGKMFLFYFY